MALLQAHAELTRALDAGLHANHGLSLSAYEVLARLAHAEDCSLRMSQLAERTQLSLSRVSRVVDHLQERGLVERKSCATDSRVVYAAVTAAGTRQIAEAQETFFEVIEERFLGKLSCDEVMTLGSIFTRVFTPVAPRARARRPRHRATEVARRAAAPVASAGVPVPGRESVEEQATAATEASSARPAATPYADVLALQRTAGNRAVTQELQRFKYKNDKFDRAVAGVIGGMAKGATFGTRKERRRIRSTTAKSQNFAAVHPVAVNNGRHTLTGRHYVSNKTAGGSPAS